MAHALDAIGQNLGAEMPNLPPEPDGSWVLRMAFKTAEEVAEEDARDMQLSMMGLNSMGSMTSVDE